MQYIVNRLLQTLIVIFGVSIFAFGLMYLTGDPAMMLLGEAADTMTVEEVNAYRHLKGFDRPWLIQYFDFASKAVRGDFGESFRFHRPAFEVVLERVPATLELAIFALILSVVLAVPIGVISATRPNTLADHLTTLGALIGQSIPSFWLGILLMMVFGVTLKWLPISGRGDWRNILLPGITLAVFPLARNMRLTRSSLLEVLHKDYIRTARAKGLAGRSVTSGHGVRNALLPLVTAVGLQVGFLLGGSVIIESIFAWPGVGRLIYMSINAKDFPVVLAGVVMLAISTTMANLLVDIFYSFLDPRIHYT